VPVSRRDFNEVFLGAMALPGFAEWLNAEPRDSKPAFFSPEDFEALESFTAILIPTDQTPGAREARCAQFIDFLLNASAEDPKMQAGWRNAMSTLRDLGYHSAGPEAREKLVEQMAGQQHPTFLFIKHLNTFAFYTSRAGQIQTLDYRGNSYNATFPACTHPEHKVI